MVHSLAQTIAAAVLALTLWAACAGVGTWLLPRPPPDRPDDALPDWNRPGVAACIGLGALLALGGVGMALHLPLWVTVVPFVVGGLVLAAIGLLGVPRRAVPWAVLVLSGGTIGAFLLVALVDSHVGLRAQLNPCDELRAYLPMVHRLIDTGAIVEPWSYRRLQNLGGFTYLQAIPVRVFGDVGIGLAEYLIAAVFLGGLFVASGFRTTWPRVACLVFILFIPMLWIPRVNVAPVLLTVPLLVGTFAATAELRVALRARGRGTVVRWSIGIGLLLAGIASVRTPNVAVAAAVVAVGALTVSGSSITARLRAVVIAAGTAVIAIGPWLIASWQSVGTPLYPFLPGNANSAVPSERDPSINTIGEIASNTWGFLRAGSFVWVALAVLIFVLIARRLLPDVPLLVILAVTSLLAMLTFSVAISIASPRDFGRYIAPMGEALAIFVFYETLRGLDRSAMTRTSSRSQLTAALAVGFAVIALAATFSPIAVIPSRYSPLLPAGWNLLRFPNASDPFINANRLGTVAQKGDLREALEHVDPEHTLLAVDQPYLMDYTRFELPNMDLPGWATPTGKFPFFQGPEAKVAALRREGFTHLVMTEPSRERCLSPGFLRHERLYVGPPDSTYARYFLDWLNDMAFVEHFIPTAVTRTNRYVVIDLQRAGQEFRDARAR